MTIKELYDFAEENGIENFDIQIQLRDSNGFCMGLDDALIPNIDYNNEFIII